MLSPVVRAKYHWFRRESREAIANLEEIVGEAALNVPDDVLASRRELPFEAFLIGLLINDDRLRVPFSSAVERLWQAFPGHYAIAALEVRGERDAEWLYAAAADGLVSTDPADHDRIGKVALVPVPDVIDRARLDAAIAAARERGAWDVFVTGHPDLMASLFLDTVFYPVRVMDAGMVRHRFGLIAEAQPEVLDLVADTLARWDPDEVARVGMRSESGDCATSLVEALRSRDVNALPATCLP